MRECGVGHWMRECGVVLIGRHCRTSWAVGGEGMCGRGAPGVNLGTRC